MNASQNENQNERDNGVYIKFVLIYFYYLIIYEREENL